MSQNGALPTQRTKHLAGAGRGRACLLAGVFAVLGIAVAARSAEIVVVTSGDAGPYQQAQTGATESLKQEQHQVRTVSLTELSAKGLEATIGPAVAAVVAIGTPAASWLHQKLPAPRHLVYCLVADPAAAGLTAGRKTYGVTTDVPLTQQFALAAEALPQARTLGLLYRSDTPEGQRLLKSVQEALPKGWQLQSTAVDKSGSVAQAIEDLTRAHVDIIWTSADPTLYDAAGVRSLLLTSLRRRIPVFGFSSAFVRAGALLGVYVDPKAQGQQAASVVRQVLKDPPDPTLNPVSPPEPCQLAVNLIVADKLGVQLPEDLVRKATQVFKGDR